MFGSPEDTPGGRALKFYASQRIRVSRKGQINEGQEIIGTEVAFRVVKNKIAPPFQSGSTILTFAKGINRPAEIIEVGAKIDAINLEGRTYSLYPSKEAIKALKANGHVFEEDGSIKLGTSKKAAIEMLEENEDLFKEAAKKVEEVMKIRRAGGKVEDNLADEIIDPEKDDIFSV